MKQSTSQSALEQADLSPLSMKSTFPAKGFTPTVYCVMIYHIESLIAVERQSRGVHIFNNTLGGVRLENVKYLSAYLILDISVLHAVCCLNSRISHPTRRSDAVVE